MMQRLLHVTLVLTLGFTPACFISRQSVNKPLSATTFAEFHPGTTTAKEVVDRLGAPNDVVQLGTRSAYRYDFTNNKTAGFSIIILTFINEDARSDRMWLFFDAQDVLTHAGQTLEAGGAEYAMPWQDLEGH